MARQPPNVDRILPTRMRDDRRQRSMSSTGARSDQAYHLIDAGADQACYAVTLRKVDSSLSPRKRDVAAWSHPRQNPGEGLSIKAGPSRVRSRMLSSMLPGAYPRVTNDTSPSRVHTVRRTELSARALFDISTPVNVVKTRVLVPRTTLTAMPAPTSMESSDEARL